MFPCPAGCVFSLGRKSSSSNRSSRRVLCLIVQPVVQKLIENYCFSRVSEGTLGSFWARFWRCSVLQSTVFPCPAGCVFSFGRKSSSSNTRCRPACQLIFISTQRRSTAHLSTLPFGTHTHTHIYIYIWETLLMPFPLSPFFRGRRQGRQPLNPAMPRRVVWEAKHSFSYPGARPCRRPSPKILQPAGVFTFLGVRGGKKEGKIWRCVLEVLVGRFLVDFWSFFLFFWYCPRVKIV